MKKKKTLNCEKKDYVPPEFEVTVVEMENGIASASGILQTGNNNNIPSVKDWEDEGVNYQGDYEL
ncbi:hypothetical protein [Elizabethkingia meningoseptica]|uniref:hypothetical protein n=1 Tax=Elizabethkingia meningoseptica TaxID=238 RepID=UPI0038923378